MLKVILKLIVFLSIIKSSYSYIDPGSGGYLLSSLWTSFITFLAFIIGITLKFFRHTLKNFIKKAWKEHKIKCILILILMIIILVIYLHNSQELQIKSNIDNREGVINNQGEEFYFLYHGKLYNQNGESVKEWNYSYLSLIDSQGYYYAQEHYESEKWGKFFFNGTPIWIRNDKIHHEIYESLDQKNIFTTSKEVHLYNGRQVEFDTILKFDKNGSLVEKFSIYDSLKKFQVWHNKLELDKPKNSILPENHKKENISIWGGYYDYYHLNSISEIPPNEKEHIHPAFNPGNLLISFRHGSMLFILDKNSKDILWRGIYDQIEGNIEGQHAPQMNSEGNIIVFDNGRYREKSRIIEINPVTLSTVTLYEADNFYTGSQGFVQPLKNGNLFITESEEGRVIEVNKNKDIIWEYLKPVKGNRSDTNKVNLEIYRAYKYEKDFIDSFLN